MTLAVASACLPPTRTGKPCDAHTDCDPDALWSAIEEAVAPKFRCDFEAGYCVQGQRPPDDAGPADDAGEHVDAGSGDAGSPDGGVDDAGYVDAGNDDGGTHLPSLVVNIGGCFASVDDVNAPITGILVARRSGPSVTTRIGDLGLIGLYPLCVAQAQALGTFQGQGSNIIFTPGDIAFEGLITFSSGTGGAPRRVYTVIVDENAVAMWNPAAQTDDETDPANWISAALPNTTDVVYVPFGGVSPTFERVGLYAAKLLVEPRVEVLLTSGVGFSAAALVAGRASTLSTGKLVFAGNAVGIRLGGRMSGLDVRENARAIVVSPLDVERGVVVTSAGVENARPELALDRPVTLRIGGDLTVGNVSVAPDFGRIVVDRDAIVEVFGSVFLRTAGDDATAFKSGELRAWGGFTCRNGAAIIAEDFVVRFPGQPDAPIESEVGSACVLGRVHVEENRSVKVVSVSGAPPPSAGRLRVDGTVLAETELDVESCCLGPSGLLAAGQNGVESGRITIDGTELVAPNDCVSYDADAVHPVSNVACSLPDSLLCQTSAACPF